MPWNQALDLNQDFGSGMKSLVLRLFWRIVLPFVLALVIAVSEIMELLGRRGGGGCCPSGPESLLWAQILFVVIIFCVLFGIAFWNTLHWGKEAEQFEAELKEADEIEKERRRRASWIVRE